MTGLNIDYLLHNYDNLLQFISNQMFLDPSSKMLETATLQTGGVKMLRAKDSKKSQKPQIKVFQGKENKYERRVSDHEKMMIMLKEKMLAN